VRISQDVGYIEEDRSSRGALVAKADIFCFNQNELFVFSFHGGLDLNVAD